MPGKGARLGAGALLIAALVGVAAWWLMQVADDRASGTPETTAPTADAARAEPPVNAGKLPASDNASDPAALAPDAAATADADTRPGQPVSFTGRVVDAAGRPVVGALVTHVPSGPMLAAGEGPPRNRTEPETWKSFARATTDAQGRFSLPSRELPPSHAPRYDIRSKQRSTMQSDEGRLPQIVVQHPGFRITAFLALAWSRGAGDVGDLVVEPGAGVTGRLVDEHGEPLEGGLISVSSTGGPRGIADFRLLSPQLSATSAADGTFQLGSLWDGEVSLRFEAEGLVPVERHPVLAAGRIEDLHDVELSAGRVLAGWVTDEAGAPLAGATVMVRPDIGAFGGSGADAPAIEAAMKVSFGGSGYERRTTAASDGSFRIEGMREKNADWRVLAAADGYEPAMEKAIEAGREDLRFALARAATIRLQAIAADGQPVSGAQLTAWRVAEKNDFGSGRAPATVRRDGDHWLVIGAGRLRTEVVVSARGHARRGFVMPGLQPGETLEKTLTLPRECVLAGRVVDEREQPVEGATVTLQPPEELRVALDKLTRRTDKDGRFEVRELTHGDWSLSASAEGYVVSAPTERTVKKEQAVEDVVLVLQRGGRVAGRLVARDPALTSGAGVQAEAVDVAAVKQAAAAASLGFSGGAVEADEVTGLSFGARADDRGEFLIDGLPPGEYVVKAHPGGEAVVRVAAGEETRVEILLHAPPRVRGRVTRGGQPVADAKVYAGVILDFGGTKAIADDIVTRSDSSGEYALELSDLMPIELRARKDELGTRHVALQPAWDEIHVVDLAFGGGVLEGVVVDAEDGTPLKLGVSAVLEPRAGFSSDDSLKMQADTDEQGRFRFDALPPGPWIVMASKSGYDGVMLRDVEVADGVTAKPLRLELRRGGTLTLHVVAPKDLHRTLQFRVRSLANAEWNRRIDVAYGETASFKGVPPGELEIEVLKPTGGLDFELLRTARVVVLKVGTTTFDEMPPP